MSVVNQLELVACVTNLEPLRYTPAGLPASNVVLVHESDTPQTGAINRQVKLTLKAVAFGLLAEQVQRLQLGQMCRFQGFLANARGSKSIVFHIQSFSFINSSSLN